MAVTSITKLPYCCSEDPDVKGTETWPKCAIVSFSPGCSEDPDVKGTETLSRLHASESV